MPPGSADPAITLVVEGWLVPLELRVLAEATPDNAPFVVASVGGLPEIEITSWSPLSARSCAMSSAPKADMSRDLADNRAELEHAVEDAIPAEGSRAGIVIKEVKFGDPHIAAGAAGFAKRQQLADQLQVTYQQEQKAQTQHRDRKGASDRREKDALVEAVIGVQVSEQNKNAAKLRG